jgi:succinate dehydrogenase/fumarate reductase-like Fe-S protein
VPHGPVIRREGGLHSSKANHRNQKRANETKRVMATKTKEFLPQRTQRAQKKEMKQGLHDHSLCVLCVLCGHFFFPFVVNPVHAFMAG